MKIIIFKNLNLVLICFENFLIIYYTLVILFKMGLFVYLTNAYCGFIYFHWFQLSWIGGKWDICRLLLMLIILLLANNVSYYIWLSWCTEFHGLIVPTKTTETNKNEFTVHLYENMHFVKFCLFLWNSWGYVRWTKPF
jgi:hypothetical protein